MRFSNTEHSIRNQDKFEAALRVLAENKFTNEDIGPINDIGAVNNFVISIPKCGTTAIQRGFERIGCRVIHAHNNLTTYEAFPNGDRLRCEQIGLETLVKLRRHLNKKPIYLFFGYREPISWYLSLAGQFGIPMSETRCKNIERDLIHSYPWNKYRFADSRRVVESASGINLFSRTFDIRSGYTVLVNENVHVILYRFDRIKDLECYINQNIDERFEMKPERVNRDPNYIELSNKLRLPIRTVEALYGDRVFSHFYDRHEAAQLSLARTVSPPSA